MTDVEILWHGEDTARLANYLLRNVVPLYKDLPNTRPALFGTGFLIRNGSAHFLVSAAHVLDHFEKLYFHVKPNTKMNLRGAAAQIFRSHMPADGDRKNDRLDIGVIRLRDEAKPPYYDVGKFEVPMEFCAPALLPREGKQYMVVGFPSSKSHTNPNQKEVKTRGTAYRNVSADLKLYAQLGLDERTHLVLPLDENRVYVSDDRTRQFGSAHGLSGSPVWSLPPDWAKPRSPRPVVVGMAIEFSANHKALIAADIRWVVNILKQQSGPL